MFTLECCKPGFLFDRICHWKLCKHFPVFEVYRFLYVHIMILSPYIDASDNNCWVSIINQWSVIVQFVLRHVFEKIRPLHTYAVTDFQFWQSHWYKTTTITQPGNNSYTTPFRIISGLLFTWITFQSCYWYPCVVILLQWECMWTQFPPQNNEKSNVCEYVIN